MTIQKFNPNDFTNMDFTMKVLILIHDIYTVGLIIRVKDEDIKIFSHNYRLDTYDEFDKSQFEYITHYVCLDQVMTMYLDLETMATENLLKLLDDIKNELESRGGLQDE